MITQDIYAIGETSIGVVSVDKMLMHNDLMDDEPSKYLS